MSLFQWSDTKYSVNIEEIDQQHKKLVNQINSLYQARQNGGGDEAIGKILVDLVDYTATHFRNEERLMKQVEYPDYADHKSKHDSLSKKVLDMQGKYYMGNVDIVTDIAILLNDWIAEHILSEDKKYAPYLNSKGVM